MTAIAWFLLGLVVGCIISFIVIIRVMGLAIANALDQLSAKLNHERNKQSATAFLNDIYERNKQKQNRSSGNGTHKKPKEADNA